MGNYGSDERIVFVSTKDIAEQSPLSPKQKTICYVGSEELTCNEAAKIIDVSRGRPWLKSVLLSDKKMLQGLKMAKIPENLAKNLVEMQAAMHRGKTLENFYRCSLL